MALWMGETANFPGQFTAQSPNVLIPGLFMALNDQYLIPGLFPFSRLCGNPVSTVGVIFLVFVLGTDDVSFTDRFF